MKNIKRYLSINNTVWLILFFVPYFVRTEKINHTLNKANEIFIQPYSTFLALILLAAFFINTEYSRKLSIVKWFAPIAFWSILGLQNNGNWHILASQIASITIFLAFLLTIIFHETLIEYFQTPSITNENKGLISDDPIESNEENDSFGRKEYAQSIVSEIRKTVNKRAFNIAVTGAWGSGKTSFLNLIKGEMDREVDDKKVKFITVKYNPWDFKEDKIIGLDLLKSISHELGNEKELQEKFKGLMVSLQGVDQSPWYKVIPYFLSGISKEKSINEYRKEIGDTLGLKGQKLVIFLDDLDRLDGDEILEVFKTIRNSFDIANTFFILGFDIDYVVEQIKGKIKGEDGKALGYLDKIFQMRLFMPSNSDFDYRRTLKDLLYEQLNIGVPISGNIEFGSLREVYAVMNSIKVLSNNKNQNLGDFNMESLLILEYIKLKQPDLYNHLSNNFTWIRLAFFEFDRGKSDPFDKFKKTAKLEIFKPSYIDLVLEFLETLDIYDNKKISKANYNKYFKLALLMEEFSSTLFFEALKNCDDHILEEQRTNSNEKDLINKLNNFAKNISLTLPTPLESKNWIFKWLIKILFEQETGITFYGYKYCINQYSNFNGLEDLKKQIYLLTLEQKINFITSVQNKLK